MKVSSSDIVALATGIIIHSFIWLSVLSGDYNRICHDGECWGLIAMDLPVSALYSETANTVTYGSLILGGVWWGVIAIFLTGMICKFKRHLNGR